MKVLCFTDNHFCEKCSIVQKYGLKYSVRLENQLASLNWMEDQAIKNNCEAVICLGDFFDRSDLNEQEITAAKEIRWNNLPHYFIVGNHESSVNTLQYSSVKILESDNHFIIDKPSKIIVTNKDQNKSTCELCFLPYIIESDRQPLVSYFDKKTCDHRVILSHNDLKGIQMGPVVSKSGFELEDIEANCDLFLNGHLHNGKNITNKIINLGNLTGKDFGEDATRYSHNIFILDLDTLELIPIENPFAFNFYKLEIKSIEDLNRLKLKNNAVVSINCYENVLDATKQFIKKLTAENKIVESRLIISKLLSADSEPEADLSELTMDYLARFVECCQSKINNTKVLDEELAEICK